VNPPSLCGQIDQIDIAAGSAEHLGDGSGFSVLSPQQLRQLGDVGGDALSLVAGEEVRRRAASRLLLEIDAGQRLQLASRMFWVAISP
jgi:hypothetical protein